MGRNSPDLLSRTAMQFSRSQRWTLLNAMPAYCDDCSVRCQSGSFGTGFQSVLIWSFISNPGRSDQSARYRPLDELPATRIGLVAGGIDDLPMTRTPARNPIRSRPLPWSTTFLSASSFPRGSSIHSNGALRTSAIEPVRRLYS